MAERVEQEGKVGRRLRGLVPGRLTSLFGRLGLRHLKWLAIVLPLAFLATYYYLMVGPVHRVFHTLPGFLLLMGLLAIGVTLFSNLVFARIEALQATVLAQNQRLTDLSGQLRSLNQASTALTSEVLLPGVLQRIADLSRTLLGARYAALAVLDDRGRVGTFVSSGVSDEVRARLDRLPSLKGALGAVLGAPGPVRLTDVRDYAGLGGFPPGDHAPAVAFLGTPIRYQERALGGLYLAGKGGSRPFTGDDEDILRMFAAQAAVAIENARLYQEVQALAVETERGRIAREMHDGLAQVLTYVNAKAQAVHTFLDTGQVEEAKSQLSELAAAARSIYADVREGILALRTQVTGDRDLLTVLREYLAEFEAQSGIATRLEQTAGSTPLALSPTQEIQALRIVQEALTNVRQHAGAHKATVTVARHDGRVRVVIADDGSGFEPHRIVRRGRPHFGLQTMRERAESVGGTLQIDSAPDQGTRVTLTVPTAGDAALPSPAASGAAPQREVGGAR